MPKREKLSRVQRMTARATLTPVPAVSIPQLRLDSAMQSVLDLLGEYESRVRLNRHLELMRLEHQFSASAQRDWVVLKAIW